MSHHPRPTLAAALTATLLCFVAAPAAAEEETLKLADDPFEITDPRAADPGEAEVSVGGSYARARRGRTRDTFGAETELELGVAPRLEVRIGQIGAYGNLETRRRLDTVSPGEGGGSGEEGRAARGGATRLGLLYQFTEEGAVLPTIGLIGKVRVLYGPSKPAYETEAVALLGKTIVGGERPIGVNLNLGITSHVNPEPGDRPNRYLFSASIGQLISRDTALIAVYVREQQERGERDFSLVQAGFRRRLSDGGPVLGFAAGFGTTRASPRFQVGFALQWVLGGGGR